MSGLFAQPIMVFKDALEPAFCDYVLGSAWVRYTGTAEVEGDGVDPEIRRTDLRWAHEEHPVTTALMYYVSKANRELGWHIDIRESELVQIGTYDEDNQGYYDWHVDVLKNPPNPSSMRKLTAVLQLTDPDAYTGGELELKLPFGEEVVTVPKGKGTIVVFPSFLYHRVTPVTSGSRSTAVAWFVGPAFR